MDQLVFHWKIISGMHRLREHEARLMYPCCTRLGLTPLQMRLLLTLHFEGPLTVTGLAKSTCTAGANNSALCKKLAQQGFVERKRDPEDERQVLISLSQRGQALVEELLRAYGQGLGMLAERLTPEDSQLILAGIDRLLAILDDKETAQ